MPQSETMNQSSNPICIIQAPSREQLHHLDQNASQAESTCMGKKCLYRKQLHRSKQVGDKATSEFVALVIGGKMPSPNSKFVRQFVCNGNLSGPDHICHAQIRMHTHAYILKTQVQAKQHPVATGLRSEIRFFKRKKENRIVAAN